MGGLTPPTSLSQAVFPPGVHGVQSGSPSLWVPREAIPEGSLSLSLSGKEVLPRTSRRSREFGKEKGPGGPK